MSRSAAAQIFTPLEIASGYLFGEEPTAPPLPRGESLGRVEGELEQAVLEALLQPPCLVAFSGGRDSSAVLAIAASVARSRGLPLPVPFTYVFPDAPETAEADWQSLVVRHLQLDDWQRIEIDDELDALGPIAASVLGRHGLYWPANAHFLVPALRAASGGSLLTGAGGDQLLDPGRHARSAAIVARRLRPSARDIVRLGLAAAPAPLRRSVRARRDPPRVPCPWLRPQAQAALQAELMRDSVAEPVRRPRWTRWMWRARPTQAGLRIMAALAADAGVQLIHPFFEPRVVAAAGEQWRREPVLDRAAAMQAIVGGLLPASVCERRTKAAFGLPYWNRHTSAYAASIAAEEVDSDLVDGGRAVDFWRNPDPATPAFRSSTLLQWTWLRRRGSAELVDERRGSVGSEPPVARAN